MKTVGILGGMGPEATARFFYRLVRLTPAERDQDHLPVLIYNLPQIPDRTEAVLGTGESPLPALSKAASVLTAGGADFISIPCNTAHFFYDALQASTSVPILHLIHCVRDRLAQAHPQVRKVGLLATKGTIAARLYPDAFADARVEVIVPPEWAVNDLHAAIHRIKQGTPDARFVQTLLDDLVEQGCEAVILGCTELSLIASELNRAVPILDSIEILAQETVQRALTE